MNWFICSLHLIKYLILSNMPISWCLQELLQNVWRNWFVDIFSQKLTDLCPFLFVLFYQDWKIVLSCFKDFKISYIFDPVVRICCTLMVRDVYTLLLLLPDSTRCFLHITSWPMIYHWQLIVNCVCILLTEGLYFTVWINSLCTFRHAHTLFWCTLNCVVLKGMWFIFPKVPPNHVYCKQLICIFCLLSYPLLVCTELHGTERCEVCSVCLCLCYVVFCVFVCCNLLVLVVWNEMWPVLLGSQK